jgi:hypothetical protein
MFDDSDHQVLRRDRGMINFLLDCPIQYLRLRVLGHVWLTLAVVQTEVLGDRRAAKTYTHWIPAISTSVTNTPGLSLVIFPKRIRQQTPHMDC